MFFKNFIEICPKCGEKIQLKKNKFIKIFCNLFIFILLVIHFVIVGELEYRVKLNRIFGYLISIPIICIIAWFGGDFVVIRLYNLTKNYDIYRE